MRKFAPIASLIVICVLLLAIAAFAAPSYRLLWNQDQTGWMSADGTTSLAATSAGNWQVKGHVAPSVTAANDLGTNSLKFRKGYFSSDLAVGGDLTVTGTVTGAGLSTTYAPAADDISPLGTHANRWTNLHMAGLIYADGGMDVYTAGALAIGAANATSVVITPATTIAGALTATAGLTTPQDIALTGAGKGLTMTEGGGAAKMGIANLTNGWATVATTAAKSNARIFVTGQSTTGACFVKSRVNDTSFDIYSTDVSDAGAAAWVIIQPAP